MKGSVRRTQLITTYGVGSIVAVEDESVMVLGLDEWNAEEAPDVLEPRLHTGGKRLRLPPGGSDDSWFSGNAKHIPVTRFPRWYYCSDPSCRRLAKYGQLSDGGKNICKLCGGPLIPSRFVAACKAGHIEDFPYWAWVHANRDVSKEGDHHLEMKVGGTSGSLAAIRIRCRDCDFERSLEGAFDRQALRGIKNCSGSQPWLRIDRSDCDQALRVTQRGASNIWFPNVRTALSIPPWSEGVQRFVQRYWDSLQAPLDEAPRRQLIENLIARAGVKFGVNEVLAAVKERLGEAAEERDDQQLRAEEFQAICLGREESPEAGFVAKSEDPPARLEPFFDLVTIVSRLREVRVFTNFSRLEPSTEAELTCAPAQEADWLPAIPVHGEGVFLRLRDDTVADWEKNDRVSDHVISMNEAWKESFFFDEARPELSARFLLAHVLAHALIDQWSLAGGYPAASLRERIYSGDYGTGLLIYTAAADSSGSLGGLIAQAAPASLEINLIEAIRRYSWCSSDPVCSETSSQGAEGLNRAACHSCALIPETSCENRNTLLDRALLVGAPVDRSFGFFAPLLDQ